MCAHVYVLDYCTYFFVTEKAIKVEWKTSYTILQKKKIVKFDYYESED